MTKGQLHSTRIPAYPLAQCELLKCKTGITCKDIVVVSVQCLCDDFCAHWATNQMSCALVDKFPVFFLVSYWY